MARRQPPVKPRRPPAEAALQRLAAIVESSDDAIIGVGLDRVINSWNPGARRIFGYSADEVLGKSIVLLAPPGREGEAAEHFERCRRGERVHFETQRRRKDGTVIDVLISDSSVKDDAGRLVGFSAIMRDITDRRLAEEAAVLRKREVLQREFVANVSHEFRTPVAAIKVFAETLKQGGLDDKRNRMKFVLNIEKHADRLSRLVEDILKLSALESGKEKSKPEAVALRAFAERFVKSIAPLAKKKGIAVKVLVPRGLRLLVDRDHLDEVLQNLCGNAIDYNRPGGRVDIEAHAELFEAVVTIRDTGFGIPKKDLPRVFERFQRTREARSRKPGGTGLGLSIVKNIIEIYGGRIWVESRLRKGSAFHLTLPLP